MVHMVAEREWDDSENNPDTRYKTIRQRCEMKKLPQVCGSFLYTYTLSAKSKDSIRYYCIDTNSVSNMSVAFGGITPPAPVAP